MYCVTEKQVNKKRRLEKKSEAQTMFNSAGSLDQLNNESMDQWINWEMN